MAFIRLYSRRKTKARVEEKVAQTSRLFDERRSPYTNGAPHSPAVASHQHVQRLAPSKEHHSGLRMVEITDLSRAGMGSRLY